MVAQGHIQLGLSDQEVLDLRKAHGLNQLPSAKPKNLFHIAKDVMSEPMFMLLVACGAVYILIGDYQEGVILLLAIFVIIGITFYQYQKTERALDALKKLSSPRALVIRNSKETRIPGIEVVPGDILLLNEGDRIPADAQLSDTLHLEVDESILTGESVPVNKQPGSKENQQDSIDLFSGSLVVRGQATAKVVSIGVNTALGQIGKSLQQIDSGQTRLQKETKVLIRNLGIAGVLISILVVLLFYLTRGDFLQAMLNGLASAMAILPEEFPVVMTVFIALGAWRLSKKKVLTREPVTIETLGSTTVLCTDKTGTITQNAMQVTSVFDGDKLIGKSKFDLNDKAFSRILRTAGYACLEKTIEPMEIAIMDVSNDLLDSNAVELIHEYALSESLMAMTIVYQSKSNDKYFAACKGAPECVFELCSLSDELKEKNLAMVQEMASQGQRVIAVARNISLSKDLPPSQRDIPFDFLGLIGLADPIRPEVPDAIEQCKRAGIQVMMITGDFPVTAQSVAKQIGLPSSGLVFSGADLQQMSDEELKEKITRTSIIARAIPEQKLRIIRALEANGEVVAMTGDGVNDAPALKAADIGVAMGNKGTDVAREAASLVLLDDNFASIVTGVRLGRRIFDNLQKAMSYILAIHIPIIGLALLPAFLSEIPVLLYPVHIVFMELIIDPVCSVAFEAEGEEKGVMDRPPRRIDEVFFSGRRLLYSLFQGFLLLGIVLGVYFFTISKGYSEGEVRAISFTSLIIGNIFLIMTNLSQSHSFIHVLFSKNMAVKLILGGAISLLILINAIPGMREVFSFEKVGYTSLLPAVFSGLFMLFILEMVKLARNHQK
jgi:Ca2+-transporting ATPase